MPDPQVLITGAGPTGLVLALWLARLGVRVRLIDRTAEPGTTSRALAVHARTLEFYRQLGIADGLVERAIRFDATNLWTRGRRAAHVVFGPMGQGLSPFPYVMIYPQDRHERFLVDRLAEAGVQVERRTELLGFDDGGDRVAARLRLPDGSEQTCEVAYLAGCDGARSTVRERLGIGFPGGTYSSLFYVADVEATGPVMDGELHAALGDADFLLVFPMGQGRARLVGNVLREPVAGRDAPGIQPAETLAWGDAAPEVLGRLGVTVQRVHWFSTYRVHHRVADRFASGRAFLLGDAGHIHSPVGGQGMNTGIGDAVNLAWKLAAVLQGRAGAPLLETYEPERIAFARRLVATTDQGFSLATSPARLARLMRLDVMPRVLPALARLSAVRRLMFRTISQIDIRYPDSGLSEGRAGRVAGGDRLPWVPGDNFKPLASLDWQIHVYGAAAAEIAAACARLGLPLHTFPWTSAASGAGLERDAVYLVRPDGYVGLAVPADVAGGAPAGAAALAQYAERRAIRAREQPA